MLRKIFGLLIFPILGASVHTYAQEEYDQQIFQYINQEKWFHAQPNKKVGHPSQGRHSMRWDIFPEGGSTLWVLQIPTK